MITVNELNARVNKVLDGWLKPREVTLDVTPGELEAIARNLEYRAKLVRQWLANIEGLGKECSDCGKVVEPHSPRQYLCMACVGSRLDAERRNTPWT